MGRLVVTEFMTLDGVIDDPGGVEGKPGGGYAFKFKRGPEGDKFKLDELMDAESLLLGRVTYQGFAAAWPSRDGEFADKMNTMPKYVVTSTLDKPEWANTTVINGDVAKEVAELKASSNGDILVEGSATLVRTLIEADLVDEFRLMIFPTVVGGGKRLFADGSSIAALSLVEAKAVGEGVMTLVYRRG